METSSTTYQKVDSSIVSKGAMNNFNEMFPLARMFPLAVMHRFWYRCSPVNFAKFLRKPFLQNTSGGCFWQEMNWISLLNLKTRKKSFSKKISNKNFSKIFLSYWNKPPKADSDILRMFFNDISSEAKKTLPYLPDWGFQLRLWQLSLGILQFLIWV